MSDVRIALSLRLIAAFQVTWQTLRAQIAHLLKSTRVLFLHQLLIEKDHGRETNGTITWTAVMFKAVRSDG